MAVSTAIELAYRSHPVTQLVALSVHRHLDMLANSNSGITFRLHLCLCTYFPAGVDSWVLRDPFMATGYYQPTQALGLPADVLRVPQLLQMLPLNETFCGFFTQGLQRKPGSGGVSELLVQQVLHAGHLNKRLAYRTSMSLSR